MLDLASPETTCLLDAWAEQAAREDADELRRCVIEALADARDDAAEMARMHGRRLGGRAGEVAAAMIEREMAAMIERVRDVLESRP